MPGIRLPGVSFMSDEQKEQYARFLSSLVRALPVTTGSAKGYISAGSSFPAGKPGHKDQEMVILRAGALSHSACERMQHPSPGIKSGLE